MIGDFLRWDWNAASGPQLLFMVATVLVLLGTLMKAAPEPALDALPIIVTGVAVLELPGPMAVQWALRLAGEIDAPTRAAPRPQSLP